MSHPLRDKWLQILAKDKISNEEAEAFNKDVETFKLLTPTWTCPMCKNIFTV